MAKQTFSVGQVLTAAQMTSLQQTAMGGGSATTKTASYTLVAADAGTTVAMTSTSATTITVNTGLFEAGDTVFIQNLGSGNCTITAGTATVNSAGSLILPQYDAGILYFVSASAAIFYDYIQVGAASPLTTKGDLYTYSTSDTRIGVGANDTVLTADSTQGTGLKWASPSAPATNFTLVGSVSLSGANTITVSGISGANQVRIVFDNTVMQQQSTLTWRINSDSGSNYDYVGTTITNNGSFTLSTTSVRNALSSPQTEIHITRSSTSTAGTSVGYLFIDGCNSTGKKMFHGIGGSQPDGQNGASLTWYGGYYDSSSTISSISILSSTLNFASGTMQVYKA